MNDDELRDELRKLGIDKASHRVVALLPLVQVAWADGAVQRAERMLILRAAEEHGMVAGDGARILQGWLDVAPTEEYVLRGRACLVELARRGAADPGALGADTLRDVVTLCERVARAAGGLFGILWTVDERERAAIREIVESLDGLQVGTLPWEAIGEGGTEGR